MLLHMLFLGAAYVDSENGPSIRFRWVKAPTSAELTRLTVATDVCLGDRR